MVLVIVTIILFIGVFIALGIEVDRGYNNIRYKFKARQFSAFFVWFLLLFGMFAQVNGNEVGIVYDPLNGGIQDDSFGEGLHFKAPWVKVKRISTKLRESSFEVYAQTGIIKTIDDFGNEQETGGGQWATYQVTIQYRVEVSNAHTFYRQFGGDTIPQATIEARIREALQSNSVEFDIFSILKGGLNDVKQATEDDLKISLLELGISTQAFIIKDVDAGEEIEQVVREEATAAKQKEIAQKDLEAQLIKNQMNLEIAKNNAAVEVAEAEGTAEAMALLKSVTVNAINVMYEGQFGSAETVIVEDDPSTSNIDEYTISKAAYDAEMALIDAIRLDFELNGTGGFLTVTEVTNIVVTQLYYDRWDGMLPEVVAGDGISLILNPDSE